MSGMSMRGGLPIGGGIGGLAVVLLIGFLFSQIGGSPDGTTGDSTDLTEQCQTGEDANANADCARVAVINSVQSYWSQTLPEQSGQPYEPADTEFFSGSTTTDCGGATSAVGPFYCPADDLVYLDTTFFDDMLEDQLGARGGPFSEAYVIAHEYGHHVQDLLGTMGRVRSQQGAESDSVRLELQADCYAGMWAGAATSATDSIRRRGRTGLRTSVSSGSSPATAPTTCATATRSAPRLCSAVGVGPALRVPSLHL